MRFRLPAIRYFYATLLATSVVLTFAALARAENEGQDDLDKAFDKKLSANSISDLAEVVDLCESAKAKGLDANSTASADKLLVGTLMQRSNVFTKAILNRTPGWGQLRIQAISDLEKALKVDPKLAAAELGIARLQSLPGGDHAEAMKAAEKAVELSKDQHDDEVDALLMLANLSETPEKQLDLFNQAIKVAPRSAAALRERGTFLFLSGKTEEAIADLDAAAKIDPENPELQEARGSAYLRLKKIDKAIEAFGDLIKIDPEQPLPYLQRAFHLCSR